MRNDESVRDQSGSCPVPSFRGLGRRLLVGAWLLGLAALVGCSSGKEKLHSVSGKVTLDGTPLTSGMVTFHPDRQQKNETKGTPTAPINSDGTYTLTTDGRSGAPAGAYKVTVTTNFPGVQGTPVAINRKFNIPDSSGLSREVKPDAPAGTYDLQVTK